MTWWGPSPKGAKMTNAYKSFDKRLNRIGRRRARLVQGYTSKVGKDGLIVFRPARSRGGFPVRGFVFLVIGFFCFKALILAHLGEAVYGQRVEALAAGSVLEQAGALVMQADPVSFGIADLIRPIVP